LTELPKLPEHSGLICQGWNWSLEDIKTHNRAVNVGAMYTTDDGKTRIYIHLEEGRTSPLMGLRISTRNTTVTIDWGDGATPNTLSSSTIGTKHTSTHKYAAAGDYVISLTVTRGTIEIYGVESAGSSILRHSSSTDPRNAVYQNSVKKIELGSGAGISANAFDGCHSLASITIPNSVTSIGGNNPLINCYSLTSVVLPDGVTGIMNYAFADCRSLASIAIPNSVTRIYSYAFAGCHSLASIVIPDSVTSIGANAFEGCHSLASIVIPDSVTSIEGYTFYDCRGVRCYDFSKHTAVPTLASIDAFENIASDCEIRVPAALYDEWIAATNWASLASKIVAV
jgi:hypothetical protein